MKETIKNLWVKALRSGEYKQGVELLCFSSSKYTSYCCLGVLCEVMIKEGMKIEIKEGDDGAKRYNGQAHDLPVSIQSATGMQTRVGLIAPGATRSLVQMNDFEGMSFEELAGVIERNWETL